MSEVGGIPEDAYDDMITDDNERRKLQGYNINKEMKINTTRMSRSLRKLYVDNICIIVISDVCRKLDDNLLCQCDGHKTQRCSETCTKVRLYSLETRGQ